MARTSGEYPKRKVVHSSLIQDSVIRARNLFWAKAPTTTLPDLCQLCLTAWRCNGLHTWTMYRTVDCGSDSLFDSGLGHKAQIIVNFSFNRFLCSY